MNNLRAPRNAIPVQDVLAQPGSRLLPPPPHQKGTQRERTHKDEDWGSYPPNIGRCDTASVSWAHNPVDPIHKEPDGGSRTELRRRYGAAVPANHNAG